VAVAGAPLMAEYASGPLLGELPHLTTFVRAAERGSFTAVATDLGISQAAVSQRIALLEKQLRVSLFDRQAGRIRLNEAGRRLYTYARKILDLHQGAREALGGLHLPVSGDLPLAASSVPGECFLPALLKAFQEKYPQVHVRATVSDSGSVLKDIETGRATVGLVGRKAENPCLESRPIGSDRLVLIIPSGHPSADRKAISLRTLSGEKLIIREPESGSRWVLEKGLERAGISIAVLNVTLELGSNAAIKDAVRRGLGVAFLSQMIVRRELDSKELQSVTVRGLDLTRHFYLVFHRRRPLPPSARVFLRFLETHPLQADQ
jgi:DNA-binding transcriptional LysR family regulator